VINFFFMEFAVSMIPLSVQILVSFGGPVFLFLFVVE